MPACRPSISETIGWTTRRWNGVSSHDCSKLPSISLHPSARQSICRVFLPWVSETTSPALIALQPPIISGSVLRTRKHLSAAAERVEALMQNSLSVPLKFTFAFQVFMVFTFYHHLSESGAFLLPRFSILHAGARFWASSIGCRLVGETKNRAVVHEVAILLAARSFAPCLSGYHYPCVTFGGITRRCAQMSPRAGIIYFAPIWHCNASPEASEWAYRGLIPYRSVPKPTFYTRTDESTPSYAS